MAQDQNIIQIRDAFMLAKRQYELTPELLADIDARRLYHALINISTLEQFDDWLAEMLQSVFHYERLEKSDEGVYGNVLGEIERIALELSPEQRQTAAEKFARLGTVDMRVIDYATAKYNHIFDDRSDYTDDLKGIQLRLDTAELLTTTDVETFNAKVEAIKDASLPPEIRDYVDFARTLDDNEREALLLNNSLYGEESEDYETTINCLGDTYNYCLNAICDVVSNCGFDRKLSVTPRHLAFQLPSDGNAYKDEHHVALIDIECGKADAWLSTGKYYDLYSLIHKEEKDCTDDVKAVLYCVADYLESHHYVLKPVGDESEQEECNPIFDKYINVKRNHPHDVVLLHQDGYYETFGDDAIICSDCVFVPLWFRSKGYGRLTPTVIFPEDALAQLRKHCNRVFVVDYIKEPDDESLGLMPCFLNLLSSRTTDTIDAHVFELADRNLAVRGIYEHTHFPPKTLSKSEAFYFQCINGRLEKEVATKALLMKKNLKEIKASYGIQE